MGALALFGPAFADEGPAANGTDVPESAVELGGSLLVREHEDGRLEFCFQPAGREVICPHSRYLNPERLVPDVWIRSSEISWSTPVEVDDLIWPERPAAADGSCQPDFERMLAATWKVETVRARGTAFHIGDGRFVTAHHVIADVPPFLTLRYGERRIAAAVLGSDPDLDFALLEVFDHERVADLPTLQFRNPTRADVGQPIYLVGYPGAGSLTAATGIVSRVWEEQILTTSWSRGGNSGGPMFDECGNVLGVVWAGSAATNVSHSGAALQRSIDELRTIRPALPTDVPEALQVEGIVVWHYGPNPPPGVDCSHVDGSWWVGIIGGRWSDIGWAGGRSKLCTYGYSSVVGLDTPPHEADQPPRSRCLADGFAVRAGYYTHVLRQSSQPFGDVELTRIDWVTPCPHFPTHELAVEFSTPQPNEGLRADLIGADGSAIEGVWQYRFYTFVDNTLRRGPVTRLRQRFPVPADFAIAAFRIFSGADSWMVQLDDPTSATGLHESARIAVRISEGSGVIEVCLDRAGSGLLCPSERGQSTASEHVEWRNAGAVHWRVALRGADLAQIELPAGQSLPGCELTEQIASRTWQVTALGENGSATYVGSGQFITSARMFRSGIGWGVVAQGDRAWPVARVAEDERNGLALIEVFGEFDPAELGEPAAFAQSTEAWGSYPAYLVGYASGHADRTWFSRIVVEDESERLLKHDGWGRGRAGAPLIDPCSHEVLGISAGQDEAVRAEAVLVSLEQMRGARGVAELDQDGPPVHGSIALLPRPVHVSSTQPEFGGGICNVQRSERYTTYYAVYLVSEAETSIATTVGGEHVWGSRCGVSDKVFILEYRSDERPSAVCPEPRAPQSPLSDVEIDFDAPPGVELLQLNTFVRERCPGSRYNPYWESTHYALIRSTGHFDAIELGGRAAQPRGRLRPRQPLDLGHRPGCRVVRLSLRRRRAARTAGRSARGRILVAANAAAVGRLCRARTTRRRTR